MGEIQQLAKTIGASAAVELVAAGATDADIISGATKETVHLPEKAADVQEAILDTTDEVLAGIGGVVAARGIMRIAGRVWRVTTRDARTKAQREAMIVNSKAGDALTLVLAGLAGSALKLRDRRWLEVAAGFAQGAVPGVVDVTLRKLKL